MSHEHMIPGDAALIRSCLRELPSVAEEIVRTVAVTQVSSESLAYAQAKEIEALQGSTQMFTRGHNTIHAVVLAAADHIKSFVAAVGRPGTTVSPATLTRGAVEALAKGYYLLTAADGRQFLQRYVALQHYEFASTKNNGYQDASGEPIDPDTYLLEMQGLLQERGIPLIQVGRGSGEGLTKWVHTLLDASAEIDPGLARSLYSQLCGISHGNTTAIGMYIYDAGDGPRLGLPRDVLFEQAGVSLGTLVRVVDTYVDFHKAADATVDRWEGAKARSKGPLEELQAVLPE